MPRDQRPPFRKPQRFRKSRPAPPRVGAADGEDAGGVRLQKVMAAAGIGSRRHCEEMIEAGRVQIDGRVAKLGDRVEPGKQTVHVDGEALRVERPPVYFLVNKPAGVVSTNYDQSGRTRVIDLVPHDDREHLFTVGRLDLSSEGLILVTNDGELANQLTHPRYGVEKTYSALVAGRPEPGVYQKLRQGVHLAEGVARCVSVYVKKELPQSTLLEIVLNEGKNREIRRILAKVGHKVLTLKRTAIGDVSMRGLRPGEFRPPTFAELRGLREATARARKPRQARPVDESELLADAAPKPQAETPEQRPKPARPRSSDRRTEERPAAARGPGRFQKPGADKFSKGAPRYGKPRPERTVLGGGDGDDRRPGGKKRFERRGDARPDARPGGPPQYAKRPVSADAGGEEGEALGSHPAPQRSAAKPDKKFARKRRPTPMFPNRKKRGKPPEQGFGTVIQ